MDVRAFDRLAVLVERVVPWLARVERPVRLLTIAGTIAAGWLIWLIGRATDTGSLIGLIGLVLVAVLILAPVAILALFMFTLRQLIGLPEQLRTLPQTTREQAARLSTAVGELRQPRQSGFRGSARGLWRLRGAVFELAGLAEPFLGIAGLVRLPFLVLVIAAALVVMGELIVAFASLLVISVT